MTPSFVVTGHHSPGEIVAAVVGNGVTKAGTVNFSFNLKGSFQELLAAHGLTDATVKNVPVTLTAGAGQYGTDQAFTYTATQGKKVTGKSP